MVVAGKWQIAEMDLWDREALDLVGPAFIEFRRDLTGSFRFIAVEGWMDCREAPHNESPGVEFTWEGSDDDDRGVVAAGRRSKKTAR